MRISEIIAAIEREGRAIAVLIAEARGSTPRETGATMLVTDSRAVGTIGGGAVEHRVLMQARQMLDEAESERGSITSSERDCPRQGLVLEFPLGPEIDQCCGGHVAVAIARFDSGDLDRLRAAHDSLMLWPGGPRLVEERAPRVVHVYGAGHVGDSLVRALAPLPFAIRWIDARLDAFPDDAPLGVETIATPLPEAQAEAAPADALHVVLTHSHALDLEIASAVLERGDFAFLGLIGSKSKRVLFRNRLHERGIPEARLARLVCPIGVPGVRDKRPEVIAACIAAQLLQVIFAETRQTARETV